MEIKTIIKYHFKMKKILLILAIVLSIISCSGQNTTFFGSYQGDVITVPLGVFLNPFSAITTNSAVLGGRVLDGDGNLPVTRNGICYNTTGAIDELGVDYYDMPIGVYEPGKTYSFSMNIEYLTPNTLYYVQAYAENAEGINFSSQGTFTTLSTVSIPAVSTNLITSINSTTATGGGIVINEGSSATTVRGSCWGTSINPTTAKPLTPTTTGGRTENGSGLGEFTSSITNAAANTFYYVRAYATNSAGTAYGINQTFTTLSVLPTVETATTSLVTLNSATSGGTVTNQGTSSATERGICYSISINPDTSQPTTTTQTGGKIISGSGLGLFSCNLTGLNSGVTYYVRAYAINSSGTSYGVNQSFTTTQFIYATLSSSLDEESEDLVLVNWNLTLSNPSPSFAVIPISITNGSGSGTSTTNFYLAEGQLTSSIAIPYSKLSSAYTAYCDFGTLPDGFIANNSTSYPIPALEINNPFILVGNNHSVALTSDPSIKSLYIASANLLVVYIAIVNNGYRSGGSPTWNGVTMTQVGSYSGSNYSEMWYLVNPDVGWHNLSIPNSTATNMQVISSWYNCSGAITLDNYTIHDNTTSFIGGSVTIPINKSLLIVEGYSMRNPSTTSTGMGYSYTYTDDPISYIVGSAVFGSGSQYKSYNNTSGTSYSMSWTSGLTDKHWYDIVAVFKSE